MSDDYVLVATDIIITPEQFQTTLSRRTEDEPHLSSTKDTRGGESQERSLGTVDPDICYQHCLASLPAGTGFFFNTYPSGSSTICSCSSTPPYRTQAVTGGLSFATTTTCNAHDTATDLIVRLNKRPFPANKKALHVRAGGRIKVRVAFSTPRAADAGWRLAYPAQEVTLRRVWTEKIKPPQAVVDILPVMGSTGEVVWRIPSLDLSARKPRKKRKVAAVAIFKVL